MCKTLSAGKRKELQIHIHNRQIVAENEVYYFEAFHTKFDIRIRGASLDEKPYLYLVQLEAGLKSTQLIDNLLCISLSALRPIEIRLGCR